MPKFSIILATRDRPGLFSIALQSVIDQAFEDLEIIVVNDGSAPEHLEAYENIYISAHEKMGSRFQSHYLIRRPKGHGQSYSINFGADQARGQYLCFLDDDDFWTDPQHLTRANLAVSSSNADIYMCNQHAYIGDKQVTGPVWLESLNSELCSKGLIPDEYGNFFVGVDDLVDTKGFCHLNCLIVKKELFYSTGGMDEGIRWECDRDLFLRIIDKAGKMAFNPAFISHHNVPDPTKTNNMTTAVSMMEKRLLQIRVLDKASLFSSHPEIREHARVHKAYALKKVAEESANLQQWRTASIYAREALALLPTLKWALFSIYSSFRAIF